MFKHIKENQIMGRFFVFRFYYQNKKRKMGRFPILVFSFQNENQLAAKYTDHLAKQELAFRANNESSSSSNRGNYVELLHSFAEKDERLARHFGDIHGVFWLVKQNT